MIGYDGPGQAEQQASDYARRDRSKRPFDAPETQATFRPL